MTQTQLLILTIGEAATFFGTNDETVSGIVKARGLPTQPMRHNAKAKGLNLSALRTIADSLGRPRPTADDIEWFLVAA